MHPETQPDTQIQITIPEIPEDNDKNDKRDKRDKNDNKDKKIKRLFGEFVQAPTYQRLERVMRRANRVIAGTVPPTNGGNDTDHSWLKSQFALWKSISPATPREEIIYNFNDIAYHLKSISHLSRCGILSYSAEERRMYSEVIHHYAVIIGHVFLVSDDGSNTAAPATNVAAAESNPDIQPIPSAPIPIPVRGAQRKL